MAPEADDLIARQQAERASASEAYARRVANFLRNRDEQLAKEAEEDAARVARMTTPTQTTPRKPF